ncbi:kinase-like protein [Rickenella mellea]|uniref:Kinase-like protein n=1 Tax=Rickenella mellea TaxID=50990 RepID=A0A4Y7Q007_9AGAM|nr:kinase-like protein [Rickenella mellea]
MDIPPVFDPKEWTGKKIHEYYQKMQQNSKRPISTVFRISGDAVVKRAYHDFEFTVMELVRGTTRILTPRLLLRVRYDVYWYAVMEYIEGTTVAEAWSSMTSATKDIVIETLHDYIGQLRQIKGGHSPRPGPLSPTPIMFRIFQFGDRAKGPFKDYAALTQFLNMKLGQAKRRPSDRMEQFNENLPLVLTHNDLNMKNVMIGIDGRIWLIDWGMSGYYPEYFEQFAMKHAMPSLKQPVDWAADIPRVTGDYPKEMEKLYFIQEALTWR